MKVSMMPAYFLAEGEDGNLYVFDRGGLFVADSIVDKVKHLNISDDAYELSIYRQNKLREEQQNKVSEKKTPVAIPGYIYAVLVGEKLKLGRARDLESRFRAYKKVCSNFREIATAKIDDYTKGEEILLNTFGGKPHFTEWFDYSEELEQRVRDYFSRVSNIQEAQAI